jgi:hypothetical protein
MKSDDNNKGMGITPLILHEGGGVDIARYGEQWRKRRWFGTKELGVTWEDPRDVHAVMLRFASPPRDFRDIRVQYWRRNWPQYRLPRGEKFGAGSQGWTPIDDWFNGEWKEAKTSLKVDKDEWIFTFNPVSEEFPDLDFDAIYRRTLKVRVVSSQELEVERFEVYTDSVWRKMEVAMEWGCSAEKMQSGSIEVLNGELQSLEPFSPASAIQVQRPNSWECRGKNATDGVKAVIWYAYNADGESFDTSIVTVRTNTNGFSFDMHDLDAGERIFIKDFDILISASAWNVSLEGFKRQLAQSPEGAIYDLIHKMPEQTLQKAWAEMPPKGRGIHFIMSCKGRRQKFGVDTHGHVFCPKLWNFRVKGKYSDRFLWADDTICYGFGFPEREPDERHLEGDLLPIIYSKWLEDDIAYEQEAFATLLFKDALGDLESEDSIDGDDPVALMVKMTLSSRGPSPKAVTLDLTSTCKKYWGDQTGRSEKLEVKGEMVFASSNALRYYVDANGRGSLDENTTNGTLSYVVDLKPGDSHTVYFKIPFMTLRDDWEIAKLRALSYEVERDKIATYWLGLLGRGAAIEVPDKWLSDFHRAYLTHVYITDDKEPGSKRYMCRVSSFNYGVFPNESCMVIGELDRRGLHEEAERQLDVFLEYQGTKQIPGNFSSHEGLYYGAGGYECGHYGQHHGWVLWCLAEHYQYTQDKGWLLKAAPSMIRACDWIIDERKATMKMDQKGRRAIEYGLMPAGPLEDVTEFWYWMATNIHSYRGLYSAAKALEGVGHPDGERLREEAVAFKLDLLAAIAEAGLRNPVVKLRDGTWVPHFPSRIHRRGRDIGWIRETLEGAMNLVIFGLIEPESERAKWILEDYEDNLYISEQYGYALPDFAHHWFSRGGFSMQPNLYGFQIPYLKRNDVKHFLRAFFNSFAVAFYPDTRMLTEHPLPTMADWSGDHFKTSDEAISCYCLRLMLLYERERELLILPATPQQWLEDGNHISVKDMVTYFGIVSFEVKSRLGEGLIHVSLSPPVRRAPETITIRLIHPQGLKIVKALVDGSAYTNFDPERSLVYLHNIKKPVEMIIYYGSFARSN